VEVTFVDEPRRSRDAKVIETDIPAHTATPRPLERRPTGNVSRARRIRPANGGSAQ
jgi:hypothetical protein